MPRTARPALPLILIVAGVFAPLCAQAHDGVADPDVKARMAAMKATAADMKALTGMARGEKPFEAGVAAARLARIETRADEIAALFESRASDPKSEARAVIWEDWADFTAKADQLAAASRAAPTTPEALTQTLQGMAESCKACHGVYKR